MEGLTSKQVDNAVDYWLQTAAHDYDTMIGLFSIKRYSDCLFYGHIVLEKLLKALVVQYTNEQAPRIHDLVRLQEMAHVSLTKDQLDLLDTVNDFNIRARYPEYKLFFYKKCNRIFTQRYLKRIISFYNLLCSQTKPKK